VDLGVIAAHREFQVVVLSGGFPGNVAGIEGDAAIGQVESL
jgi:hypothetical protein